MFIQNVNKNNEFEKNMVAHIQNDVKKTICNTTDCMSGRQDKNWRLGEIPKVNKYVK